MGQTFLSAREFGQTEMSAPPDVSRLFGLIQNNETHRL